MIDGFCNLDAPLAVLIDGIERGEHLGGQLYVWRDGAVLADCAFGEARPGVAMRTDSVMNWLSAGKSITAAAVGVLVERGEIGWDDRVVGHWPEFSDGGKQAVTLRQVLTHTAGLRGGPARPENRRETIGRIEKMKIEPRWVLGETAGYSPAMGWDILGEVIRRVDGRGVDEFVAVEVAAPCGMPETSIGLTDHRRDALGDLLAGRYDMTEAGPRPAIRPETMSYVRPGGNVWGPTRELGRFFQMMLDSGRTPDLDQPVLAADTIHDMTTRHRSGKFDKTFAAIIDYGLGVLINSWSHNAEFPYNFGRHASPDTFGHGGSQCANAFADPAHDLVVAWVVNGQPGEPTHQARNLAINDAVYAALGISAR